VLFAKVGLDIVIEVLLVASIVIVAPIVVAIVRKVPPQTFLVLT